MIKFDKQYCGKCGALIVLRRDDEELSSCNPCQVACSGCGAMGMTAFTIGHAFTLFRLEHGSFVGLDEIAKEGGPPIKVMRQRIKRKQYPDALNQKCEWRLPLQTAEAVIVECQVEEKK